MSRRNKFAVLAAIVVLISVVVFGIIEIWRGFSARDEPSVVEQVLARTVRTLGVPSRVKHMKNPVPNTPENLHEAMAHWADHCAFCHANNGSGDTEVGKNLYPKAPDMRLNTTQNMTDGELYYTINNGIRLTGMPAWGEPGEADEDSWKLVYFIRHLPHLTPEEEREMERLNPKGPEDRIEEKEEDEFLKSGEASQPRQQHKREPIHH